MNRYPVLAAMGWVAILFLGACGTPNRTVFTAPQVEGATWVGNKACVDCHAELCRVFPMSPHARVLGDGEGRGCESCHGPGSRHVEVGGGKGRFIVNPGRNPAACYSCHVQVEAEFHLPKHHPVPEGAMNCSQCHDPHGTAMLKPGRGLAMPKQSESCVECHREEGRMHVFEHEALREGCTTCHQPHGSAHAKLLVERDANLCLKCHAQVPVAGTAGVEIYIGKVPHAANLRLGGCWSAGCHTAVHGSQIHPRLFY
jgi:predicted CXXCH cytochrome family protein